MADQPYSKIVQVDGGTDSRSIGTESRISTPSKKIGRSLSLECGPNDAELSFVERFDSRLAQDLLADAEDDVKIALQPDSLVRSNQPGVHQPLDDDKAFVEHQAITLQLKELNQSLKETLMESPYSQVLKPQEATDVCFCDVWAMLARIVWFACVSVVAVAVVAQSLSGIASTSRTLVCITCILFAGQALAHVCHSGLHELNYSLWELVQRLFLQSIIFPLLSVCLIAGITKPSHLRARGDFILCSVLFLVKNLLISLADVFGTYDAQIVQAKFSTQGRPLPDFMTKIRKAIKVSLVPNIASALVIMIMFLMIVYGVPVIEGGSTCKVRKNGILLQRGLLVLVCVQVGKAVVTGLLHRLVVSCFPTLNLDNVAKIMLATEGYILLGHRVLINAIPRVHQVLLASILSSSVELVLVFTNVRMAKQFAFDAEKEVSNMLRLTDTPESAAFLEEALVQLEQSRRNAMVVSDHALHAIFLEYTTVGMGTVMVAAFHASVSVSGFGKAVTWSTAPSLLVVQFGPEVLVDAIILYYIMSSGFSIRNAWNSFCSRATLAHFGTLLHAACFAMLASLSRD